MSDPSKSNEKPYSERPLTPSHPTTGFTSIPVPGTGTPPTIETDPYRYQPGIAAIRPDLGQRRQSSNYAQAAAAALQAFGPVEAEPVTGGEHPGAERRMSYSKDDQKKMMHDRYMKDDVKEKEKGEEGKMIVPKSPGIGNSEVMGREYGFTSASYHD